MVQSRILIGPGETYAPRICRTPRQPFLGRPHSRPRESQNAQSPSLRYGALLNDTAYEMA